MADYEKPDERYDRLGNKTNHYPLVNANPLNRETAFGVQHHKDFASTDVQRSIATALQAIQHTHTDHCMAIGGDYYRGGRTTHVVVTYHPEKKSNGAYEVRDATQSTEGQLFETLGGVYEHLQTKWRDTSFTYVAMLATTQTTYAMRTPSNRDRTAYEPANDAPGGGYVTAA